MGWRWGRRNWKRERKREVERRVVSFESEKRRSGRMEMGLTVQRTIFGREWKNEERKGSVLEPKERKRKERGKRRMNELDQAVAFDPSEDRLARSNH